MARGRSPAYQDQREMILSRAAQLFAERGFAATSMNEVAEACGMSKPSLYHYFRDKYALLVNIAEGHVTRLESVVDQVRREPLDPKARLERLIRRFVEEYANARHAHQVLTGDVRFLDDEDRERVLAGERRVVAGFADTIIALRPELDTARMAKPLTMLLFGMINWMFTWLKPDGELTYEAMAPVVADLFFGGIPAVSLSPRSEPSERA
ncbi:MAG TPA: TetR/AcrR family transcriptional regulator [Burkholderiaceae bacterium]|nr:TetR/AcrR family transcriptional regulator [Burkholderiaceae bacterium]